MLLYKFVVYYLLGSGSMHLAFNCKFQFSKFVLGMLTITISGNEQRHLGFKSDNLHRNTRFRRGFLTQLVVFATSW